MSFSQWLIAVTVKRKIQVCLISFSSAFQNSGSRYTSTWCTEVPPSLSNILPVQVETDHEQIPFSLLLSLLFHLRVGCRGFFLVSLKTTPTFRLAKLQALVIRWSFLKLLIFVHIASSKAFVFKSLAHKWCKWYEIPSPSSHLPSNKDEWNMRSNQNDMKQCAHKWAMPATHL